MFFGHLGVWGVWKKPPISQTGTLGGNLNPESPKNGGGFLGDGKTPSQIFQKRGVSKKRKTKHDFGHIKCIVVVAKLTCDSQFLSINAKFSTGVG